MDKARFPKEFKVYWPLLILFAFLLLISPKSGTFKYDYKKGAPWSYETLVAQFDFPILKSDRQIDEDLARIRSFQLPYYKWDAEVSQGALSDFNSRTDLDNCNLIKQELVTCYTDIYERGIIDLTAEHEGQDLVYIQIDGRATEFPVSELYSIESASNKVKALVKGSFPFMNADSLCTVHGLYRVLVPNLIYDVAATELIAEKLVQNMSYIQGYKSAGEIIIENGEIITDEKFRILESYEEEYNREMGYDGPVAFLWLGNGLVALIIIILLLLTITYTNPNIFQESNRYHYLLVIFVLASIPAMLLSKQNTSLLYIVPYNMIAVYLIAFFRKRVVLPVYMISLLPLLIYATNNIELFVMHLVSGVLSIYLFGYFNKGWKQFVMSLLVFISLAVVYLSFRLIRGTVGLADFVIVVYLFIGSFLSVAVYPLIFLFEKIFSLVSSARLADLCDTNNPLLRELAQKAPGTFHHSLQLMNMADEAARSIYADVLLIRAGAMYHDIGKMKNAMCFVENQMTGVDYHSHLSPKESASFIVKHVQDGEDLARKNNLPSVVIDFITTHHGTTSAGYFHTRYLNEGGDPDDTADFFYKGHKPTTKEQVILMLCDSIEAASRTLSDYSPETISALVEKMTASKMDQFTDADISLKELETVKHVVKEFIAQVHHARIVYPKRNS